MLRRLTPLLAVAALSAACDAAPSDARLRHAFSEHRAGFQQLCESFPGLGADAIGRGAGVRLAARGRLWFEPVSDAVLREAGVERAAYSRVVDTLGRLGALSVQLNGSAVSIIMHRAGTVASSTTAWLECNPGAPAPTVADSAGFQGPEGRQCSAIEPGWWICREWG